MEEARPRKVIPPGLHLRHILTPGGALAWRPGSHLLVVAGRDSIIRTWNSHTGEEVSRLHGYGDYTHLLLLPEARQIIGCARHETCISILHSETGMRLSNFYGHGAPIRALALTPDGKRLVSASADGTLKVWGMENTTSQLTLHGHGGSVNAVVVAPDSERLISGGDDGVIRSWDILTGKEHAPLGDHKRPVTALALSSDGQTLVSGSEDRTICFWNLRERRLTRIVEGHTATLVELVYSPDERILAARDSDHTIRLWRCDSLEQIAMLTDERAAPTTIRHSMVFHPYAPVLATADEDEATIWDLDYNHLFYNTNNVSSVQYTTAKVALVGDSGVGKTALGHAMVHRQFRETISTHGQQFWILDRLRKSRPDGVEQEVVLWDFAGQPDYRLIHSLFLDDVDLVLLLFDASNRYESLRGVEYWLNQLQDSDRPVQKILVGARLDRGAPRMTDNELLAFCRYYDIRGGYVGSSALKLEGIDELLERIDAQIDWERMTATVTTTTFKRIKSFVLNLKADPFWSKVLVTPAELRDQLQRLDPDWEFTDKEMMTAVRHLENHGYVSILPGEDLQEAILLAPDLLINLASSFVLQARRNSLGLGALEEDLLIQEKYPFPELEGLTPSERTILREAATVMLLEHHVCFREYAEDRTWFIFPSLINQKRPYIKDLTLLDDVSYRVTGAVENIYAALVVRLSYAAGSTRSHYWQNQAQFEMGVGEICGFRLIEVNDGEIDLVLYYGTGTEKYTRVRFKELFEKFLKTSKVKFTRYPPVRCPNCGYQQDRGVVVRRIQEGKQHIYCVDCGEFIDMTRTDEDEIILTAPERDTIQREHARSHLRTAFEMVLVKIKSMFSDREKPPSCFISYAWGKDAHEQWVLRLATHLREADIEVVLDQWHGQDVGGNLARFISRIEHVDFILVVGTPRYRQKYLNRVSESGSIVAAEVDLINLRLLSSEAEKNTVLPLLVEGDDRTAFPPLLQGRVFSDFRQERFYFSSLFNLILTLYEVPKQDPVIDELRSFMRYHARTVTLHDDGVYAS